MPKRRLRFSLMTLLLSTLLLGSGVALWLHWEPWVLQATIPNGGAEQVFFSKDRQHVVFGNEYSVSVYDAVTGADLSARPLLTFNAGIRIQGVLAGQPVVVSADSDDCQSPLDAWKVEFRRMHAEPITLDIVDRRLDETINELARLARIRVGFSPRIDAGVLDRQIHRNVVNGEPFQILKSIVNTYDLDLEYEDGVVRIVPQEEYELERRRTLEFNVQVKDLETGRPQAVLSGCTSKVTALAISPQCVCAGCNDGSVHIWNEAGKHVARIVNNPQPVRIAELSTSGTRVGLVFSGATAAVYDRQSGKALTPGIGDAYYVALSCDGTRALFSVWGAGPAVQLWDVDKCVKLREIRAVTSTIPIKSEFSADGARLFTPQFEDSALIDAVSGERVIHWTDAVLSGSFSPAGGTIAVSHANSTDLCDAKSGFLLTPLPQINRALNDLWASDRPEELAGHIVDPFAAAAPAAPAKPPVPQFSPDGQQLVARRSESDLGVWVRRRPERWWGLAWLPEFWVTFILALALLANTIRNWRRAN